MPYRMPIYKYHFGLPAPGKVSEKDGPMVRIGTPEWNAWYDYYVGEGREFSRKMMEHYAVHGVNWPTTTILPPVKP